MEIGVAELVQALRREDKIYNPETENNKNYLSREFKLDNVDYNTWMWLLGVVRDNDSGREYDGVNKERANSILRDLRIDESNGYQFIALAEELNHQVVVNRARRDYSNTNAFAHVDSQSLACCLGMNKFNFKEYKYAAVYDLSSLIPLIVALMLKLPLEVVTHALDATLGGCRTQKAFDFVNSFASGWSTLYSNIQRETFTQLDKHASDFVVTMYEDYFNDQLYAGSVHLSRYKYDFATAMSKVMLFIFSRMQETIINDIMKTHVYDTNEIAKTSNIGRVAVLSKGMSTLVLASNTLENLTPYTFGFLDNANGHSIRREILVDYVVDQCINLAISYTRYKINAPAYLAV